MCTSPARQEQVASPAAPTAVAPGESGDVSASADDKERVTLCHYDAVTDTYADLVLPANAMQGHLNHGDRLGSCTAATCPCFTTEDIAAAASLCLPERLLASCAPQYSLGLFCALGSDTGAVANLGYWQASVGAGSCFWIDWDPATGDAIETTLPVDAAQFEACRNVLVSSLYYPAGCPE